MEEQVDFSQQIGCRDDYDKLAVRPQNAAKGGAWSGKTVVDTFGDTDWASLAMLRQGECFAAKGQKENAKLFYEEVLRLYPKSEAATEARELLES